MRKFVSYLLLAGLILAYCLGLGTSQVSAANNNQTTGYDLSITKTHSGNFTQGQTGVYTITVTNIGDTSEAGGGNTQVVDDLPAGLTPTAATGDGWVCIISDSNVTCQRSDELQPGNSYPDITLTVSVADNAPASVINSATVSLNASDSTPSNNTATDPTTIDLAPTTIGQITPLGITCSQFVSDSVPTVDEVLYTVQNGRIRTVNPSAFIYYSQVNAPGASNGNGSSIDFGIKVTQSNDGGWPNLGNYFSFFNPQVNVYDETCTRINTSGTFTPSSITFNVNDAEAGEVFYVGIRYQANTVVGLRVTAPYPTVTYTFVTSVDNTPISSTADSVIFTPAP